MEIILRRLLTQTETENPTHGASKSFNILLFHGEKNPHYYQLGVTYSGEAFNDQALISTLSSLHNTILTTILVPIIRKNAGMQVGTLEKWLQNPQGRSPSPYLCGFHDPAVLAHAAALAVGEQQANKQLIQAATSMFNNSSTPFCIMIPPRRQVSARFGELTIPLGVPGTPPKSDGDWIPLRLQGSILAKCVETQDEVARILRQLVSPQNVAQILAWKSGKSYPYYYESGNVVPNGDGHTIYDYRLVGTDSTREPIFFPFILMFPRLLQAAQPHPHHHCIKINDNKNLQVPIKDIEPIPVRSRFPIAAALSQGRVIGYLVTDKALANCLPVALDIFSMSPSTVYVNSYENGLCLLVLIYGNAESVMIVRSSWLCSSRVIGVPSPPHTVADALRYLVNPQSQRRCAPNEGDIVMAADETLIRMLPNPELLRLILGGSPRSPVVRSMTIISRDPISLSLFDQMGGQFRNADQKADTVATKITSVQGWIACIKLCLQHSNHPTQAIKEDAPEQSVSSDLQTYLTAVPLLSRSIPMQRFAEWRYHALRRAVLQRLVILASQTTVSSFTGTVSSTPGDLRAVAELIMQARAETRRMLASRDDASLLNSYFTAGSEGPNGVVAVFRSALRAWLKQRGDGQVEPNLSQLSISDILVALAGVQMRRKGIFFDVVGCMDSQMQEADRFTNLRYESEKDQLLLRAKERLNSVADSSNSNVYIIDQNSSVDERLKEFTSLFVDPSSQLGNEMLDVLSGKSTDSSAAGTLVLRLITARVRRAARLITEPQCFVPKDIIPSLTVLTATSMPPALLNPDDTPSDFSGLPARASKLSLQYIMARRQAALQSLSLALAYFRSANTNKSNSDEETNVDEQLGASHILKTLTQLYDRRVKLVTAGSPLGSIQDSLVTLICPPTSSVSTGPRRGFGLGSTNPFRPARPQTARGRTAISERSIMQQITQMSNEAINSSKSEEGIQPESLRSAEETTPSRQSQAEYMPDSADYPVLPNHALSIYEFPVFPRINLDEPTPRSVILSQQLDDIPSISPDTDVPMQPSLLLTPYYSALYRRGEPFISSHFRTAPVTTQAVTAGVASPDNDSPVDVLEWSRVAFSMLYNAPEGRLQSHFTFITNMIQKVAQSGRPALPPIAEEGKSPMLHQCFLLRDRWALTAQLSGASKPLIALPTEFTLPGIHTATLGPIDIENRDSVCRDIRKNTTQGQWTRIFRGSELRTHTLVETEPSEFSLTAQFSVNNVATRFCDVPELLRIIDHRSITSEYWRVGAQDFFNTRRVRVPWPSVVAIDRNGANRPQRRSQGFETLRFMANRIRINMLFYQAQPRGATDLMMDASLLPPAEQRIWTTLQTHRRRAVRLNAPPPVFHIHPSRICGLGIYTRLYIEPTPYLTHPRNLQPFSSANPMIQYVGLESGPIINERHEQINSQFGFNEFFLFRPMQELPFAIDATFCGTYSRFFNHCCQPNVLVIETFGGVAQCPPPVSTFGVPYDHLPSSSQPRPSEAIRSGIGFFAPEPIVAGSEITFNYSMSKSEVCSCASELCTGDMEVAPGKCPLASTSEKMNWKISGIRP